jgi:hypothetical protein
VVGNPHRGEITSELYFDLRGLFDGVLRCLPRHILNKQLLVGEALAPVYVFKDGKPADWVDPVLEMRGLMLELTPEAFSELSSEFIRHGAADAFHQQQWWRWCFQGNSVWVEIIPEAIAAGKHKPRSLSKIMGKTT